MFLNEKREFSTGCTEDRRAGCKKGRSGGLRKKTGRPAEKGSPPAHPFLQPALMCSPLARPVVQPAGSPFCAACQPLENSCFSFGNTALRLVLSAFFCIFTFIDCVIRHFSTPVMSSHHTFVYSNYCTDRHPFFTL